MFVKENVNPKNKKTGDCVIRAIAKATDKSWMEVFDALVQIARKKCTVPNSPDCYSVYLKDYSKVNVFHEVYGAKKRYTVADVTKWKGTYIISIAGHVTCVSDGILYDLWDCSRKSAYVIWRVK